MRGLFIYIWDVIRTTSFALKPALARLPNMLGAYSDSSRARRASRYIDRVNGTSTVKRSRASRYRKGSSPGAKRINKILFVLSVPVVIALLVMVAQIAYAKVFSVLPSPSDVLTSRVPGDVLIYGSDGTLIADVHQPGVQRIPIPLSQMGKWLPEATIAIEDPNFYNEQGIDPYAILRAAVADIRCMCIAEGGSTITQQLVKLRLLNSNPTLTRKLKEAILAIEVSQRYSKAQILQMYLNTVYYGSEAYGARAAAWTYFRKLPSQLDLAQAALLAGLPQSPTLLDPLINPSAAKARQLEVLKAMVKAHYITKTQAEQAAAEKLHFYGPTQIDLAPDFVSYVMSQVQKLVPAKYAQDGVVVHTTLNYKYQQVAEQDVKGHATYLAYLHVTDAALVALNPSNGAILAMVGSLNHNVNGGDINMALVPRQTGSSFKIFTYSTALQLHKVSEASSILDAPYCVPLPGYVGKAPEYCPHNYDYKYHGVCLLGQCIGNSFNVPAVKVEMLAGIQNVVKYAHAMGATIISPNKVYGPSLTLGGYAVPPIQMAAGAATLADLGAYHKPFAIQSIYTPYGKLIYQYHPKGVQVLDPRVAFIMAQMLSYNPNRAEMFGLDSAEVVPGRTVAAKTGTSNNYVDGWTLGWTPQIAVAVWAGNANDSPALWGADGVVTAGPIWQQFMEQVLATMPPEWYQPPPGLIPIHMDGQTLYLIPGTKPGLVTNIPYQPPIPKQYLQPPSKPKTQPTTPPKTQSPSNTHNQTEQKQYKAKH